MDRQRPAVLSAAVISLVVAVFALVMAWTTTDDGSDAAGTTTPPAAGTATGTADMGAPAASDGATSTFEITIDDFEFAPGDAVVAPGTTVVFTNNDTVDHSIVADDDAFAASLVLDPGETYEVMLTEPGTYTYICGIHTFMTGTITVQG